ncbi:hypothetical protein AGR1B_Cc90093 [Agrobacterium fabacearum S56]|nr:hypothetical protein AGR1B_Cc90093 [Agrobacterium fabacearum S56]
MQGRGLSERKDRPLSGAPYVLLVEHGYVENDGLLCFVRVVRAGVNAQVLHLTTAERAARDHALDGLFNDALREATFDDLASRTLLDATRVTGVPVVLLVGVLVAGEGNLFRVDDDDVVAIIDVGGVGGLVLAAQAGCNDGGEATNNEAFGVDDDPLLLHLSRLLNESRHGFHFLTWTRHPLLK